MAQYKRFVGPDGLVHDGRPTRENARLVSLCEDAYQWTPRHERRDVTCLRCVAHRKK